MEKLETPKKKHDHKATKILKFSIFAFVMLAPFISVISKVAYVSLNKNAKDSYYGEEINEKILINPNNFKTNETYYIYLPSTNEFERQTNHTEMLVANVILNNTSYNINTLRFYVAQNSTALTIQGFNLPNNDSSFMIFSNTSNNYELSFTYINETNTLYNEQLLQITKQYQYNKYSYLDNAMSYGINELQNDNLYNWSKNTGIYNAILGMTDGLGANNTLAMLLAYWSIITAIYIVFDIVIEIFIKLTHLLN